MEKRVQTVCLIIIATIAIGATIHWLQPVMIPFVLAIFITLGLRGLVDLLIERFGLPRGVALAATLVAGAIFFVVLGLLIAASVEQLSDNVDAYETQFEKFVDRIDASLPAPLRQRLMAESELQTLWQVPVEAVGGLLMGTTNAILQTLSKSLLVLIFVMFLMVGGDAQAHSSGVWGEVEGRITRYLVIKALVSLATGILVGTTLAILGVDLAIVFGLFALLLNFIPNIGSIVATFLPLPVVIVSPHVSFVTAILAIAIPGAIQFFVGNVLEPKLMGRSLDLHPVIVLLSLIFWGMIWGIVGMLLATPMTAVAKILFEKLPTTRPLADLMAGRLDAVLAPAPD